MDIEKTTRNGLEIISYEGENYKPLMAFQAWRVATLNHGPRFEKATYLERHLLTDEVFVLLVGEATLLIGEDAVREPLVPGKVYNVKAGVWHAIETKPGTSCLIVENDDTSRDNSEYRDL